MGTTTFCDTVSSLRAQNNINSVFMNKGDKEQVMFTRAFKCKVWGPSSLHVLQEYQNAAG